MRKYKQEPYTVPPWIYNAIQVLRPAERLTVSEWAAKYRILPDGNAIPGPWSNSVTPYLVEIMDAFSDDTVEEIVFVKPTQVGGTSAMENMLGSLIAHVKLSEYIFLLSKISAVLIIFCYLILLLSNLYVHFLQIIIAFF